MAIVRYMVKVQLQKDARHKEVSATYSEVKTDEGRFLQIDTYGSSGRKMQGKKSQSIRLAPAALKQLRRILLKED